MPEEKQTISVQSVRISSVQVKPSADILLIVPDRSAKISYVVGKLIPGAPEVPMVSGIVGRGKVLDDRGNVVTPAIEGKPAIPAVPAIPDSIIQVDSGAIEMTDDEWKAWKDQDDLAYRSAVVAKRLGWTIV